MTLDLSGQGFSLTAKQEEERRQNLGVWGRLAPLARAGARKIRPRPGFCPVPCS